MTLRIAGGRWDVSEGRRHGPVALLRQLVLLAALVYVALFAWTGRYVGNAEAAYSAGRLDEAHVALSRAAFWHVRAGRVHDALGVVDLARGRLAEGQVHLAEARRGFFHPPAFGEERVLLSFLRQGLCEPALIYASHRLMLANEPATAFYLGVAENGLNRLDDATGHLAAASADTSLKLRVDHQLAIIAEKRRTWRADYLIDRNGKALAGVDTRTGRPALLLSDLAPLIEGPFAIHLRPLDTLGQVRLTIDLEIQRAAEAALGSRPGSLVAIDVATGGVLAAASQPASVQTVDGQAPPALSRLYEPGSIIKMLTLTSALRTGVDVEKIFPIDCPGWAAIDGVAFRDWIPHRRIESIEQAVAASCNIAFGRMAQAVGRDALNAELRRFGFDDRSGAPTSSTGDFKLKIGALLPEDSAHPSYALARRGVGLDSIEITPIGAALLAAGLARGGAPPVPYIIEEKINLLGESDFRREAPARDADVLSASQAALVTRAMKAAVAGAGRTEGTARRAAVKGMTAAMKTGTSGRRRPGYDALVIGFAPADRPVIAWGLAADHAGKAEFEGARITGEFLKRIRHRLK